MPRGVYDREKLKKNGKKKFGRTKALPAKSDILVTKLSKKALKENKLQAEVEEINEQSPEEAYYQTLMQEYAIELATTKDRIANLQETINLLGRLSRMQTNETLLVDTKVNSIY